MNEKLLVFTRVIAQSNPLGSILPNNLNSKTIWLPLQEIVSLGQEPDARKDDLLIAPMIIPTSV